VCALADGDPCLILELHLVKFQSHFEGGSSSSSDLQVNRGIRSRRAGGDLLSAPICDFSDYKCTRKKKRNRIFAAEDSSSASV
jgi:hypothetical protein